MMKKYLLLPVVLIISISLIYGCNIVPKSVQYQKEEGKLLGSTDTINPRVEEIQVVLTRLGYNIGIADGMMGQKTRDAIKEFQESMSLKSTGYINKRTLTRIEDIRREKEEGELKKEHIVKVISPYSHEDEFSVSARDIQAALKGAGFDPGAIDGKMGPMTEQAVKEFQRTKGLVVDGKVGPKTWAELARYLE